MQIDMAHIREQGIDFAVFGADAPSRTNADRDHLLTDLTRKARASGLKVDKAALAYSRGRRIEFYGTPDLVRFLSTSGLPSWTHRISA